MARAILVAGAALLLAVGCGSPQVTGSAGTGPLAFSACVRAHGIPDYPDPTASGSRVELVNGRAIINGVTLRESQSQVEGAQQACARSMGAGTASKPPSPQIQRAALAYAQCMRAHGVPSFPDPTFAHGGVQFADHGNYDPNSQTYGAADGACRAR